MNTFNTVDAETFEAQGYDRNIDQWVANSLLQKAIRRGDAITAEHAALAFHKYCGSAIWRRFIVIAFEDVGIADLKVVAEVTGLASNAQRRKTEGGDKVVAGRLARSLAFATKNRSSEHLITTVLHHPRLPDIVGDLSPSVKAALNGAKLVLSANVDGIDWLPKELGQVAALAFRHSREAIVQMAPVLWKTVLAARLPTSIERRTIPELRRGGIPLYALDKHTRKGRLAIRQFVQGVPELRSALTYAVERSKRTAAAYMLAFYADAVPLAERLIWPGSHELEVLGREADMHKVGINSKDIEPLLSAFTKFQTELDEARARVLSNSVNDLPLFKTANNCG